MNAVVIGLEVLGLLLIAAAAGVAGALYFVLWAGLLAAGAVVLAGAAWAERPVRGGNRERQQAERRP